MKIYTLNELKGELLRNLGVESMETLKEWEKNPYLEDRMVADTFWGYVKIAPAIGIVGDYDCDGICASYIIGKAANNICPGKKMLIRIPHRFSEGYGINETIREEINEKLPKGSVVITVDNGIAAADVLEGLESDGYVVLMTDHHDLREGCRIPNVTFKVDPAVPAISDGFSWKKWCGAAIAYKLSEYYIPESLKTELMCYAGLATIADCMELKEANWSLVRNVVKLFRAGKAPSALCAMLTAMRQDPLFIDEDAFGFYLGPCFNAPGRLLDNGAGLVLKYLFSPDGDKLKQLIALNDERKQFRDDEYETIRAKIREEGKEDMCPIWVNAPGLHEGIVGILAGKVAEDYKVPAIVTTTTETPGLLKGSARSAGNVNIFEYLSSFGELFERMGGHPGAAGLSITEDNFKAAEKHQLPRPDIDSVNADIWKIEQSNIPEIKDFTDNMRPFGEGNPKPIFSIDVDLTGVRSPFIGENKDHLCIRNDGFKITHFFHIPNNLHDQNKFRLNGNIADSAFNGETVPTFNAEEAVDEEEGYEL